MDVASLNVLTSRYTSQTSNVVTFCKIQHIYSASVSFILLSPGFLTSSSSRHTHIFMFVGICRHNMR